MKAKRIIFCRLMLLGFFLPGCKNVEIQETEVWTGLEGKLWLRTDNETYLLDFETQEFDLISSFNEAEDFYWSNNGEYIAYFLDSSENTKISLIDMETLEEFVLVDLPNSHWSGFPISWSPDDLYLYAGYRAGRGSNPDLDNRRFNF